MTKGYKWRRRLEIIKTFPDGHTATGVAVLFPAKKETDLNPFFVEDGEYYYWGEGMKPNQVGVYHPSVERVGYGKMTARILTRIQRNEALGISLVPPDPHPADSDDQCLMGTETKCED